MKIPAFKIVGKLAVRAFLVLLFTVIPGGIFLFGQQSPVSVSSEKALQLYSSGNYDEAYLHYSSLIVKFPADPIYRYYSGLCLVFLEKDPDVSVNLLKEAKAKSSSLRPVPSDIDFFLGRAYHQAGRFSQAIDSYDLYSESARRKEVKDYKVDELILQCTKGLGSLAINDSTDQSTPLSVPEKVPDLPLPDDTIIEDRSIFNEVKLPEIIEDTLDPGYDIVVSEALKLQFQSDSVNRLAERYRSRLNDVSGTERESISRKILALEEMGFNLQSEADKKFKQASFLLDRHFTEDAAAYKEPYTPAENVIEDTIASAKLLPDLNRAFPDSLQKVAIVKEAVPLVPEIKPVFQLFEENYKDNREIPVNQLMPDGLYYRIQTAAFRNPVSREYFKSLGPVFGYKAADSDITFYYIGMFRIKSDADRALVKVRNRGFTDAFVVALLDGNRISPERAASIEPDWKNVSLISADSNWANQQETDSIPQEPLTLVYRVELQRVSKALKQEEVDHYKKLAGGRVFDVITSGDKEYIYLIGKFITFESAATYSDLLFRNGVKEVKVVAYLGKREIPLEKAKELFDLYFNKQ